MLIFGVEVGATYPAPYDHIAVNPMSLIVFISALGGLWTFLVRFLQAKGEIKALDEREPLPQPNQDKGAESTP
jgi:hypothetical protein